MRPYLIWIYFYEYYKFYPVYKCLFIETIYLIFPSWETPPIIPPSIIPE